MPSPTADATPSHPTSMPLDASGRASSQARARIRRRRRVATETTPSTTGESKAARRFAIVAVVVVVALIALNLLARGLDRAVGGNEPSGVAGSSYGTQPTGLAAAAALFTRYGHPVTRQRGSLAEAT